MSPADRAAIGRAGMTQKDAEAKFLAGRERELQKQISGLLSVIGITFGYSKPQQENHLHRGVARFLISL